MKRHFYYTVTVIASILLTLFFSVSSVQAVVDSGITYGPYIQRVSKQSATVLLETDEDQQLTLHYRLLKEPWQTQSDSDVQINHRYRLKNLKRDQSYQYYISRGPTRLTQTYTFQTQHTIRKRDPLRVAVVGDAGVLTTNSLRVANQILNWEPDILLHTGDVAYTNGTTEEFSTKFFPVYQSIIARSPMYPTIGNHDSYTESAGPYKTIFELPQKKSGNEDYYSFNYDQVHFISLNTNLDYSVGSAMYTWLEEDLRTVPNSKWIIVFFHHPPYSSGSHGGSASIADTLVPLFEQYGVNLVLNGHDHTYERSTKDSIVYIVTGGGGGSLYTQDNENSYSQVFESIFHFTELLITKKDITVRAIDMNGYKFDSVVITR